MSGQDEDEAWRAIVENYGERPRVDDPPAVVPEPEPDREPFDPSYADVDAMAAPDGTEDRFVPPEPPPAPPLRLPQHLPWIGVFGSPLVLLVALLTGITLPPWLGYALVGSFIGGFVWLVATMKRGGPDPWDDGARL